MTGLTPLQQQTLERIEAGNEPWASRQAGLRSLETLYHLRNLLEQAVIEREHLRLEAMRKAFIHSLVLSAIATPLIIWWLS